MHDYLARTLVMIADSESEILEEVPAEELQEDRSEKEGPHDSENLNMH